MSVNALRRSSRRHDRSGTVLVLVALMMVFLLTCVALAVDVGVLELAKTQLQRAADAGALAGADALRDGPASARLAAQTYAQYNALAGSNAIVDLTDDIELGKWDDEARTFQVLTGADEDDATAVRVTCKASADRGNPCTLFFARVLGKSEADVEAFAIAILERNRCSRIIGIESVTLTDGWTDSFKSDLGSYGSQTPGNEGHVCSNHSITVNSGGIVDGNAAPGKDDIVNIGPGGIVTGSTTPNTKPISVPPIDASDASVWNDNGTVPANFWTDTGKLDVKSGETLTLDPGTYYVVGGLKCMGQIEVTGPTTIYVVGEFTISGQGIVNLTQVPADLTMFVMGTTASIGGQAAFYGTIYAPGADVTVNGQGGLFGAVVGRTLKITGNSAIHADESLPFDEYSSSATYMVQ